MESDHHSDATLPTAATWKWVAPLFLMMFIPMLLSRFGIEPTSGKEYPGAPDDACDWNLIIQLCVQLLGCGVLVAISFPEYLRSLPFRISWWSIPLGVFGCVLWVAICELQVEAGLARLLGQEDVLPQRSAVDPSESYPVSWIYQLFLGVRFAKLALLVPLVEEVFLRGFLLRYVQQYDWWKLSMQQLPWSAVAVASVYGVLTHPGEILAAIVWFGGVTIWTKFTNRFWDAVVIHAVTNLALGLYVLQFGQWQYW